MPGTAYPFQIEGRTVQISSIISFNVAELERQVSLSGADIKSQAIYFNADLQGTSHFGPIIWENNTLWLAQNSGAPALISVYSW